ncbi:acyclic terpene utilization AtuA family protein [Streptomyces canus]|uniref:acyclic terpene utilization AtuA family protein n=1 Tax=Streptomyces canus TaxID=58343 RepID=UPI0003728EDB|nr:acyclic terpene utilization AtuA family protein [Streptomyces canus]
MSASLPIRIFTPQGMLGYGYDLADFHRTVEEGVDLIVVDSGSTDPGPYMLGLGKTLVTVESYARDLRPMLRAVADHRIPLVISSAGGAGTDEQVARMTDLVDRLADEEGLSLRVVTIGADMPADVVADRLARGLIEPNVRGELPSEKDVREATGLVAQMGAEPFLEILATGEPFDVIIAGRAYDPAPHAAFALHHGVEPGIAWHMGKILECGGACAEPKGGGVVATVYRDRFELSPSGPAQRCTPLSVAAHTLYEKSRPDLLPGPGGVLDVRACVYEAVDERTVRVRGSRFLPSDHPVLKVEGAAVVGHRAAFIGGIHDPVLIAQLDTFLERVERQAGQLHPELAGGTASLAFHVYGRNGVMGPLEPSTAVPHEVGILGEVTAESPELALAICTTVRIGCLHLSYPGQMATAGNMALPLNPMESPIGPVCAFTLYHLMDARDLDLFPVAHRQVGRIPAEEATR